MDTLYFVHFSYVDNYQRARPFGYETYLIKDGKEAACKFLANKIIELLMEDCSKYDDPLSFFYTVEGYFDYVEDPNHPINIYSNLLKYTEGNKDKFDKLAKKIIEKLKTKFYDKLFENGCYESQISIFDYKF